MLHVRSLKIFSLPAANARLFAAHPQQAPRCLAAELQVLADLAKRLAAAPHAAHSARLAAGAALQRLLASLQSRVMSLFGALAPDGTNNSTPGSRCCVNEAYVMLLLNADEDCGDASSAAAVRVTLLVVPFGVPARAGAAALHAAAQTPSPSPTPGPGRSCAHADGAADSSDSVWSQMLQGALLFAAAALALLLMRRRGVPVDALIAALRHAPGAKG